MGLFKKKEERREEQTVDESTMSDPLLKALIGQEHIDRDKIMNIPAISACVNKIADTVSALDIKLYRRSEDKIEEVEDYRTNLLNKHTGDTLDACQFKKAMVIDMLLGRGGYAYINKVGQVIKSIHYVDETRVGFIYNSDPIFKDYKIQVNGKNYEGWQFIKLLRNTNNGYYGKSIVEESQELLDLIYSTLLFEKNMVKTGGNKKGFIKATNRLAKDAMTNLKEAFRKLYSNNTENIVILNDGLDFKESSNTSVEMQLNENKKTNSEDICKIFLIPPSIINGGATEDDKKQFIESCIIPILVRFAIAIDAVMLMEDEKENYFYAFDTTDLVKGDIEKRFNAYKTALESGFMQIDEVRKSEKLPSFDLDFVKLGLQDVLYFPKSKEIYTPNTNKLSTMGVDNQDIKNSDEQKNVQMNQDKNNEEGGEIEDEN